MNPLRAIQNTLKIHQAKKEILALSRKHRPKGLELPADDEVAAIVTDLITDHPELTVVKTQSTITLYHRADLDPTLSPDTKKALEDAHLLLTKDNIHNG